MFASDFGGAKVYFGTPGSSPRGNKYCAKSPRLWRLLYRLSDPTLLLAWFLITIFGLAVAGFLGQSRPGRISLGAHFGEDRGSLLKTNSEVDYSWASTTDRYLQSTVERFTNTFLCLHSIGILAHSTPISAPLSCSAASL